MKSLKTFIATFALICAGAANAGALDDVARAAINGPEIKKLKVVGHEFNIKKADVSRMPNGDRKIIGQISHHLRMRKDDQIYYTIIKDKKGKIIKMEKVVERGGGTRTLLPVIQAAGIYAGKPIPANAIKSLGDSFGQLSDGEWEKAASIIVDHIAAVM